MSRHKIAAVLSAFAEIYHEELAEEILADPLHFADEILREGALK